MKRYGKIPNKFSPHGKSEKESDVREDKASGWNPPRHCHSNEDYLRRWLGLLGPVPNPDRSPFICSLLVKGPYLVSVGQCPVNSKTLKSSGEKSTAKDPGHHVSFFLPAGIKRYLDAHTSLPLPPTPSHFYRHPRKVAESLLPPYSLP